MVIGIDHLHIHNGKFAPYVEVCWPQGPIFEYKGAVFFLAIKTTTWLWFQVGMVICIHHPHIHNGKYTPYVELCGLQGPISKIKGALRGRLFLSKHCITGLWFGVVHPQYQCATSANRFHVEVLGILKTWFAQAVPIYDPWVIITYT